MSSTPTPPLNPFQADLVAGRPAPFPAPTVPPPETPASRAARTIPAQWFQDLVSPNARKINLPILITNAIIDGPLNLSYVTFECAVEFSGCDFIDGAVDFSFATFSRSATFSNCHFLFPAPSDAAPAPVSFRAIHACADLTLAGSEFPHGVDCSDMHVGEKLVATGARFGKAEFDRIEVAKSAEFGVDPQGRRTEFNGETSFCAAHICSDANFYGALFSKKINCEDIRFDGNAYFCDETPPEVLLPPGRDLFRLEFLGEARFLGARISGDAVFIGAKFADRAVFDRLQVTGIAYFRKDEKVKDGNVLFHKDAHFPLAVFSSGVQFNFAHFETTVDFHYVQFHGAALFLNVQFDGSPDFTSASADSDVQFNDAVFAASSSFREARFRVAFFAKPPDDRVRGLFRTRQRLQERTSFDGGVDLRGFSYERIYVDLDDLLPRLTPFDRQPFNQLESVFRKTGADALANKVYLKRRSVERKRKFDRYQYHRWMADWGYMILASYGVRPWLILIWAVGTLAFGAWLFMQPNALDAKDPKRNAPPAPAATLLPALGVSFHQFLPVDVPIGDYWVPASRAVPVRVPLVKKPVSLYPSVYSTIALRIFGTLLQALLIGQFTGFLRRAAP